MAGAGYKLFNTGDVLTATDVNTYLMQQTVMVFDDAAARTTALAGVVAEGMLSYLKDTNAVEVYDGANWVASDDPNAIQNTIIAAKGDIITGTADDTPAVLTVGSNETRLVADSGETTGLKYVADTTNYAVAAKGDLLAGTAADTLAALTVGANGTILTADSGETTGLKWAAVERPINTAKISTSYLKNYTSTALTSFILDEDVTYYYPIYLPNYEFSRISIRNPTSNTVDVICRLGIYNSSATTGLPTTVYLDAGTVAVTTALSNFEITISNTPPAGYYYLAVNAQTITSGTPELAASTAASTFYMHDQRTASIFSTTIYRTGFSETGVTGAFATAGTLTPITSNPIVIALRMA